MDEDSVVKFFDNVFDGFLDCDGISKYFYRSFDACNSVRRYTLDGWASSKYPQCNAFINKETKELTFKFVLFGYKIEDISIELSGNFLKVSAKEIKTVEDPSDKKNTIMLFHSISDLKSFEQMFYVPDNKYNYDGVSATMKNGILVVIIPAKEGFKKAEKKIIINSL